MMKTLPAGKHLNDEEYNLLLSVYANHNRSMGRDERIKYSLSHVVKVVRNVKEKCLEVHYSDGNWWHYSVNGSWY